MGKHQATTLVMTPEELAALPVVQVEGEPDIWLTSGEKQKWGLLWIFECLDHGKRFALVGRSVTRPGSRARWRQGAISLPSKHRRCHHRVWREGEWRLEVPDPLCYIAAPATLRCRAMLRGAIVEVAAICSHGGLEARLDLSKSPGLRHASVTLRIHTASFRFAVRWDEAFRRLRELAESGGVKMEPISSDVAILVEDLAISLGYEPAPPRLPSPQEVLSWLQ